MRTSSFPSVLIAVSIAALAGFVDAYAFIRIGNFFVSFMSGNATRGGVALGGGIERAGPLALSLVLAFLAGVMLAAIAARRFERVAASTVMALATGLLAAAAAASWFMPGFVMPLLAAAMGAINGVLSRQDGPGVGLTYMTGNLVRLGQALAGALMGERPRWAWVTYLSLWLTFVGGAVGGTIIERAFGNFALVYAAIIAGWLTLLVAAADRSRPEPV